MTGTSATGAFANVHRDESAKNFLVRVLTPVLRVLLRLGFSCDEINQANNKIAVDIAMKHREFYGRKKAFVSHASVVTGLSRKIVTRLWNIDDISEVMGTRLLNRGTRVLCGWQNDPRYRDPEDSSQPIRYLPYQASKGVSFHQLAREYAADIPPRSVHDALLNAGAIKREGNQVELLATHYLPDADSDEIVDISGFLAGDVLGTIEHNLRRDLAVADRRLMREWFQRYVPTSRVPEARAMIGEEAMRFGSRLDERLAEFAHRQPMASETYERVGLGVFYVQEPSNSG